MRSNGYGRHALVALLAAAPVWAQGGGTTRTLVLEPITVRSTRVEKTEVDVPLAVGAVQGEEIQLGRQQLGLDESLGAVPGIFFQNRYNFAQDLRISIRGFGARANFGIRGLRVFSDGIPSSLPDGQAGVDDIDLGAAERIEVIRGPSSSLYGAAAGGVVSIYTEDPPEVPFVEGRLSGGAYGFRRAQLKGGDSRGALGYVVSASHTDLDGYRAHSRTESSLLTAKARYRMGEDGELTLVASAVDSPEASDPGGLKATQVAAQRTQAQPRNVQFDAGESIEQQKIGLVYRRSFGGAHEIRARGYALARDFAGKLPFSGGVARSNGGQIAFDRTVLGGGLEYRYTGALLGLGSRLIAGVDLDAQDDDRQRFVNDNGLRGALTMDQTEKVSAYGVFVQDELRLHPRLELTAGLRYDRVDFEVKDRFLANTTGDDSGSVDFDQWSPRVGAVWRLRPGVNLYGNISTSFETPTTTEFANPSGGGFNQDLSPQRATNYELGLKGSLAGRARYDLAVYQVNVDDELVAFELASQSGRSFFRNAGRSTRKGIEAAVTVEPLEDLTLGLAYTFSSFRYDRFSSGAAVLDGNTIPGIPKHQLRAEATYFHPSGFYASGDVLLVDRLFADDANTVTSPGYAVTNLRAGYLGEYRGWEISPFVGINNALDRDYNANVRLNASFGRYFEPAPRRNLFAGVTIRYDFGR